MRSNLHARAALSTLAPTGKHTLPQRPASFRAVLFSPTFSHGAIGGYTGDRDRAVDVGLDSLDAANEGPDGSLPRAA